jgi:hypothetical protein
MIEIEVDDEFTRVPYQLWSPITVLKTESNIPTEIKILNRKYVIAYLQEDDGAN